MQVAPVIEDELDLVLVPIEGLPGPPGHQHGGCPLLPPQEGLHAPPGGRATAQPGGMVSY